MGKGSKKSKSQQNKKSSKNPFNIKNEKYLSKTETKLIIEENKKKMIFKKNTSGSLRNKVYANITERKEKEKIFKKFKLKSLASLNIQPPKDIKKMNINELKNFAHIFDINPEINYRILLYLKASKSEDYNKYIPKYKYTLNFKDTFLLKCFDKHNIYEMLKDYNENIIYFKLKVPIIDSEEKIISFSRIKLFNLLFFILKKDIVEMELKDINQKIFSYSIEQSLIFKIPNKFGNVELKYYTYLIIVVNLLMPRKIGYNAFILLK